MSDIVLGTLIALSGVIIGGLSSYIIARLQIRAHREELNQQLSHQEREAQRNSLIEARKDHLLQLRNIISNWVECSHQSVNMNVRLKKALKNKGKSLEKELEIREYIEVSERGKRLSSQLAGIRGEISDNILDNLIDAVLTKQYEIDLERMPLVRFFNEPGSVDIKAIESAMHKDEALRKEVRKIVLQVNKRIEELLSGEPSS